MTGRSQEKAHREIEASQMEDISINNGEARLYELVMPEEFGRQRTQNLKYPELHRAIGEMKSMPVGRGLKLKCSGTPQDAVRKQKAAVAIASRRKTPIRTMLRGGWLFLERVKERRDVSKPAT
jgi:hypothetical protein